MNRLGLKISCVAASILIWIQVAATSVVEQPTNLPLRVAGLGTGLTVAGSELPDRVPVRLRGSKLTLLTHTYFNRYVGEVRVNLSDRGAGPAFSYQLAAEDVYTELEMVRFQRDSRIRLHIDEAWTRRLPVALVESGEWPEDVGLLAAPQVVPDSVTVAGPARFFESVTVVTTRPLERDRHDGPGRVELDLESPNEFLLVDRREVAVDLALAPLEERTLANVPVVPLVDAGQPGVGVSPPVADVMVRGVADSVRALTEDRVAVTVAVGDRPEGVYELPGMVDYPPWLTLLGLTPRAFQVIVGDPPLGATGPADSTAGAQDHRASGVTGG